jgi:prepilin-type N-terminal cleavage/methylation domain-containing protein
MRPRGGLTLLEIVVALLIAGLAMTSGYAALTMVVDRRSVSAAVVNQQMAAAELRQLLERLIGGAELTIEEDRVEFRGLDGYHNDLSDDILEFRTSAFTTASEPGSLVRLFVDRSDSTPGRGLTAEIRHPGAAAALQFELDSQIVAFDVRYLSGHRGALEWSTSWVSSTILPLAAQVTLRGSRLEAVAELLRLPILIPMATP